MCLCKAGGSRLGVVLGERSGRVLVDKVHESSLAEDAGLAAGSVVVAVNGVAVARAHKAQEILAAATSVELALLRPATTSLWLYSPENICAQGLKFATNRDGVCIAAVPGDGDDHCADIECGSRGLRVGDVVCAVGGRVAESPSLVQKALAATGWVELTLHLPKVACADDRTTPTRSRLPLEAMSPNRGG